MRISDWSSDVCSSDLGSLAKVLLEHLLQTVGHLWSGGIPEQDRQSSASSDHGAAQPRQRSLMAHAPRSGRLRSEPAGSAAHSTHGMHAWADAAAAQILGCHRRWVLLVVGRQAHQSRSEKNTSELQSLMSTQYADFVLQKKNN